MRHMPPRGLELGLPLRQPVLPTASGFGKQPIWRQELATLAETGFAGKLGLSIDKFHGMGMDKAGPILPDGPQGVRS